MKKKLLLAVLTFVGLIPALQNAQAVLGRKQIGSEGSERQYYRILKANHGTQIEGLVGWLSNDSFCGAHGGALMGRQGCAVVKAEAGPGFMEGESYPGTENFYYIKEYYLTGTPPEHLVGFIVGSHKMRSGIGGDTALGVFKANNY